MNFVMVFGAAALAQAAPVPLQGAPAVEAPAAQASVVATASFVRLPALTPLRLRVIGEVSSKTNVKGDKVVIALADPLVVSGALTIPAGTRGVAEVIHAAKGGMGGKAGELLIAARYLQLGDVQIPLRSFRLAAIAGKNNEDLATGLSIAGGVAGGIAAMMITGGASRVADGSEAFAKTGADVDLPIARLDASDAAPATTTIL
jgi:hypothetical protein